MLLIVCSRLRRSPEGDCCVGEMRFAHFSHTTISLFARRSLHARPSSSRGCQRPPCAPLLSRTTISPLYIEAATLAHPLREAVLCGKDALRASFPHNTASLFGAAQPRESTPGILYHPFFMRGKS